MWLDVNKIYHFSYIKKRKFVFVYVCIYVGMYVGPRCGGLHV